MFGCGLDDAPDAIDVVEKRFRDAHERTRGLDLLALPGLLGLKAVLSPVRNACRQMVPWRHKTDNTNRMLASKCQVADIAHRLSQLVERLTAARDGDVMDVDAART